MNALITVAGRKKMAAARTGQAVLPAIVGMAFGDGGVTDSGEVLEPQDSLRHELIRKPISRVTKITETCYRYAGTLGKEELAGEAISEFGLYDAEGDLVVVKTCSKKTKDADMEMIFEVDDNF